VWSLQSPPFQQRDSAALPFLAMTIKPSPHYGKQWDDQELAA
jgi:hypothetical protein